MSAGNSTYSPLPQSNSDSDGSSEEELHVSQGNRIINRNTKTQSLKSDGVQNDTKSNVINYKPLDNDGEVGITLNKFHSNPDEVSILKPYRSLEIFSTSRKICFVFSLLLCVFTTVAFIWILPCNVGTCPSTSDIKTYNFTWEETLSNLEIYGPSSLVSDRERNYNLVVLTRNHLDYAKNYSESGVWCLNGKDGSVNWKIKLKKDPTDLDCRLIDVNSDGLNDCLVYSMNSLKAINSVSGKELWDLQKSNKKEIKLSFGSFPLILPDVDKDDINELLLLCSFATVDKKGYVGDFRSYVVIVSGKTGAIINKPLRIKFCSAVRNLMFEGSSELSYICQSSDGKESFQKIPLAEVYQTVKNSSDEKINLLAHETLNQHLPDSNTVQVDGFRLKLVNQGNCPEDCSVLVEIKDERGNKPGKIVESFKKTNTYGMKPVVLKTERESGFILKFWKWCSKRKNYETPNYVDFPAKKTITKNITKNIKKRSKKLNLLPKTSTILDNEMLLESEREFQREKRTINRVYKSGTSVLRAGNINLHVICETVVKVNLNGSQILISNIAKDEIIQICRKSQVCQPDAYQQRHSILIAQTDKINAKLITFTPTYVHVKERSNQHEEIWQLQSRISVTNI